jgi:dihydropteroate synthase
MGIVNVTPDSFSDGGKFFDRHAATDHALELVHHGADLVDIGGESTRPYATPVETDEELRRVIPVLENVCPRVGVPVSIDTSKSEVAREAIAAGAQIINDVTGLEGDAEMAEVARQSAAGLCIMHMQGTPQTMQDNPTYGDVVQDVYRYLKRRRDELTSAGIDAKRICLDPGIGFGKTHQHNLTLLANCYHFHNLGCPILVGPSRKGFLRKVLGNDRADRATATIGVTLALARQGVQILRVHDVAEVRDALLVFEATGGLDLSSRRAPEASGGWG